jgi:hypothetical protein
MVPVFCSAADSKPFVLDCGPQMSVVTNPKEPIEIAAQGFSYLPPQGEDN